MAIISIRLQDRFSECPLPTRMCLFLYRDEHLRKQYLTQSSTQPNWYPYLISEFKNLVVRLLLFRFKVMWDCISTQIVEDIDDG